MWCLRWRYGPDFYIRFFVCLLNRRKNWLILEGLPKNMSGKFNLVRVGPHYPDTKPRRSFLSFRKRWCTPQRTDAVKVLRRKGKRKKFGRFINGRIDAVGLPNVVVFAVDRYSTVCSYLQWTGIRGMWNVCTLSSHSRPKSSGLSLHSRLSKQNPIWISFCPLCAPHAPLVLTLRRLMSYIYGAPILDVSRSHTTTQHSR